MMKRVVSVLLVLVMLTGMLPVFAQAENVTQEQIAVESQSISGSTLSEIKIANDGNIIASGKCGDNNAEVYWCLYSDGTMLIYGTGKMANYEILSNAPWYTYRKQVTSVVIEAGVTKIGWNAFREQSNLTSISIPNTVTWISDYVFNGCSSLTDLSIPESVIWIGRDAFNGCTSLNYTIWNKGKYLGNANNPYRILADTTSDTMTSFTIHGNTKVIAGHAFHNCASLSSLSIPDGVVSVGQHVVRSCSSLKSITFPDSVTRLGSSAFVHCTALEDLTLPNNIDYIDVGTFYGCTGLKSVTIPAGVTVIDEDAFSNCGSLTDVYFTGTQTQWNAVSIASGNDKLLNAAVHCYSTDANGEQVIASGMCGDQVSWSLYPDNTLRIWGSGRMADYSVLNNVPWYSHRRRITSVVIEEGVTKIGWNAFREQSSLASVTIPDTVTEIDHYAFYDCTKLTSFTIPDSIIRVGDKAFQNCTGIAYNVYNNGKYLGNSQNPYHALIATTSTSVDSFSIHPDTKVMGNMVFDGCSNLTAVTIPDGMVRIGGSAFRNCINLTKITIPDSVFYLGENAFRGCSKLTKVTLPKGITKIPQHFFEGSGIKTLTIPNGVTSIGADSFQGCTNLSSITIPSSVTSIVSGAFMDCRNLLNVYYAGSKSQWNSINIGADNEDLLSAIIHCNSTGTSADQVTASGKCGATGDQVYWCFYPNGTLRIWGTGWIANYEDHSTAPWYSYRTKVTSVVIEPGVTKIGWNSFRGMTRLTNVVVPDTVTWISDYVFYGCSSLSNLTIPNSVIWIGRDAFNGCSNLSYTIWNGGRYLGNTANPHRFLVDTISETITSFTIHGNTKVIAGHAFHNCTSLTSLTIPDGVVSVGQHIVRSCSSLKSITFPNSVTRLGSSAFVYCTSLEEVTLPINIDYIDVWMFYGCTNLKRVSIPAGVTRIDEYAFYECPSLEKIYFGGSEAQWKAISVSSMNSDLSKATVHYNSLIDPNISLSKLKLEDIGFGPYALKGAVINVAGYEIPLIDIEANISLKITDHLKIVSEGGEKIKVLIGFDEKASANIDGNKNSTAYWSESYKEVKSMYQSVTGQKVDTTRLWNQFSSMRGKLKELEANMVVNTKAQLAGYLEFTNQNGIYSFSEGGMLASFTASTSLRSYYGPCYVALGVEAGVDGKLYFSEENDQLKPQISVKPKFTISAGGGIGTRSTYAQIDAFGTLSAIITTEGEEPFSAGLDIGVRWMGYIVGKKIFSDSKTFASVELYPNFGDPWTVATMRLSLTPNIDVSETSAYNDLINSAVPVSRDYLAAPYALRAATSYENASFVKSNAYPLSSPNLVGFDDDTMMLVWIDDTGEKSDENMCSLMYSYFDGVSWSAPTVLYEDGTMSDMPSVYSDGRYAYVVWQEATQVFGSDIQTSDQLQYFDLFAAVYDSATKTFSSPICVNTEDDTVFEVNPVIYGNDGSFRVAWIENTDNNVYEMSGNNSLQLASFDLNGNMLSKTNVVTTSNMLTNVAISDSAVYYSIVEDGNVNLYHYDTAASLVKSNINDFDIAGDKVFYSDVSGFHVWDGKDTIDYTSVGSLNSFSVKNNGAEYVLFTTVLKEDFTKTLYYSRYSETDGQWTDFEVYSDTGTYIRDYSPVILSDNAVHVAFNYITEDVENDIQKAAIVVGQCTDQVDIAVQYAVFEYGEESSDSVNISIGIQNNSSSVMDTFDVCMLDAEGNAVLETTVNANLSAFSKTDITVAYTLPENYTNEKYTIKVYPAEYIDLNETDNEVTTTLECIHVMGEWSTVIAPTCTQEGQEYRQCIRCKLVEETRIVAATGHNHNSLVTLPTCTEPGYTTYLCDCGDSFVADEFAVLGHSYKRVTVDATCTDDGSITDTCITCGDKQVEIIPAKGHSHEAVVTAPTCTEKGYTTYTCHCGDSYTADEVAALGHSYKSVTVDATCTADGSVTETCSVCGDTKTQVIPAKGHSFANGTCGVCGAADPDYVAPVVQPTLKLKAPALEFKDMIKVVAFYEASNLESVVEMGMITYTEKVDVVDITTAAHVIPGAEYDEGTGRYFASSQGIHAKYLCDDVYLAIYAKLSDGSYVYTRLVSYGAVTYATNQLKNSTDMKLKQLVAAMLNYGAAAQNYFGHNTENLANATLTEEQKLLPEAYSADMISAVPSVAKEKQGEFASNKGFGTRKPAVSFEGAFSINYFFTPNYAPVDGITLYYWTEADFNAVDVLTVENASGSVMMEGEGTSQYRGDVVGIAAKNLTEAVYVAAVYSDGTSTWTSGVLGYSIGSYCGSQATGTGAMADLAMATAVYGYHAKQYFSS